MPEDKQTEAKETKKAERKDQKADAPKEAKHRPRAKPDLTPEEKADFDLSRDKKARNPRFRRQEWFRYQKVGVKWRKPRGLHSKMRRHIGYRPNVVSEGYRTPRSARGRHPSGFMEVIVYNLKDMEGLDPKKVAIRIGHSVGYLKRMHIALKAEEMHLRILNFNRQAHEELLEEAKNRGIELPSKGGKAKGKHPKKGARKKEAAPGEVAEPAKEASE